MRKTRAFLLGPSGQTNYYHVISRVAGKYLLFGDDEKETFRHILMRQLKFSGLRALAWCFMGNHFHLLLEVPDKTASLEGWEDENYITRLQILNQEWSTQLTLKDVQQYRENGADESIHKIALQVKERLFDLSMFMKELKMKMTLAYNKVHDREGTLWQARFKSVLLESGNALRAVAAYIDLNPIRAGLAQDPASYRWCSYAAAVAGIKGTRQALSFAVTGKKNAPWKQVAQEYRCLLFGLGEKRLGGQTADGSSQAKAGFTQTQIDDVWQAGGKMPLEMALRCRVRYFSDGAVLGGQNFVDEFFNNKRDQFGSRRKDGGRKMRGAQWGELRVLRDLGDGIVRSEA
ncbi:MAG: transposase [Verrucomicrobiales bacterium]|nr:transposase [Verrucomicrobiales bacterium]